MAAGKKPPGPHAGHREREKRQFLANGLNGLPDHKVMELVLFYAIPQGDVNPLAHRLVEQFGSLAGVLNATYDQLLQVDGVGPSTAALLHLIPAVSARYMAQSASFDGQIVNTWQYRELLQPLFFGTSWPTWCAWTGRTRCWPPGSWGKGLPTRCGSPPERCWRRRWPATPPR